MEDKETTNTAQSAAPTEQNNSNNVIDVVEPQDSENVSEIDEDKPLKCKKHLLTFHGKSENDNNIGPVPEPIGRVPDQTEITPTRLQKHARKNSVKRRSFPASPQIGGDWSLLTKKDNDVFVDDESDSRSKKKTAIDEDSDDSEDFSDDDYIAETSSFDLGGENYNPGRWTPMRARRKPILLIDDDESKPKLRCAKNLIVDLLKVKHESEKVNRRLTDATNKEEIDDETALIKRQPDQRESTNLIKGKDREQNGIGGGNTAKVSLVKEGSV